MKDTPPITGVAEIALSVRNLPLMRDFYREVLGFTLLKEECWDKSMEPTPDGSCEGRRSMPGSFQLKRPSLKHGSSSTIAVTCLMMTFGNVCLRWDVRSRDSPAFTTPSRRANFSKSGRSPSPIRAQTELNKTGVEDKGRVPPMPRKPYAL